MGAIGEAMVAFARPLIDRTDGSPEQLQRAFLLGQLCWNHSLLPKDERDGHLSKLRAGLAMGEDEFEELRQSVIAPMVLRHEEMFPMLHQRHANALSPNIGPMSPPVRVAQPRTASSTEKYPGTEPYSPCPCNSGKKYKFCCRSVRQ